MSSFSTLRRSLCAPGALLVALVASACAEPSGPRFEPTLAGYAAMASELYGRSLESARTLRSAVGTFVEEPGQVNLEAARRAWIEARRDYGLTEALRFASGPIDGPGGPEALLNAWPLDESYIDRVLGAEDAGFIQAPERVPSLDAESLIALNERDGEENVATGWHAIEFMLWGQDRSVDGPGERDVSDFVDAPFADRRRVFLQSSTELLVENLEWLEAQWRDAPDTYRDVLLASDGEESLRRIFSGLVEMVRGEIAGERMVVPYETRSQEDEQSCFSDTTTNDLVANIEGVATVLLGEGRSAADGAPTLLAFLTSRGADADAVVSALATARSAVGSIPSPFDALLGPEVPDADPGRQAMAVAIERLEDLAMVLERAATTSLGALPPPPE